MSRHIDLKSISLYLDERLGREESRAVESHLSRCRYCQEELTSLKAAKRLLSALPQVEESEGFDFEFRKRLEEESARQEKAPAYHGRLKEVVKRLRPVALRPVPVLVRATALVTIAAFIVFTVFWSRFGAMPAVAFAKGDVEIYDSAGNQWRYAKEGMRLKPGDRIKVGSNSRANVESRGYEILLKEETELEALNLDNVFKKGNEITYGLDRGKMLVATKNEFGKSRFKIDSPLAEIEAGGTGFLVNISSKDRNRTWVGVLDGEVEVRSKIEVAGLPSEVLVEEGKATDILPDSPPSQPRYLLEEEWKEVQEIYSIGEQPQVALLISMTPRRVHELLRPAALYISAKKAKPLSKEAINIMAKINDAIAQKDKVKHLDAIRRLEDLIEKYPNSKYNIQFLFFIAGYYCYINEYDKSVSTLDRIIDKYPHSKQISLALCAKAIICEKGLKDTVNSASSYNSILTYYPQSLEAEEARAGLDRLKKQ